MRVKRRSIAEIHIWETLRGSLFDPAYGAQSARTPGRERVGQAVDAVLATRPSIATLEALDELLEAVNARANEIRSEL
jgi:hypothetical protein